MKTKTEFQSHIKEGYTEQTGGGVMVDYLVLTDDFRIGITDECITLLKSLSDENYDETDYLGIIWHYEHGEDEFFEGGSFTFIDECTVLSDDDIVFYDVVILKNGIVFTIDDAQITVFESYRDMEDASKSIGIIERP